MGYHGIWWESMGKWKTYIYYLRELISRILYLKRLWLFILKDFYKSFLATYPRNIAENQFLFLLFGLAPSGVYNAIYIAINAVCSYHTISPLPSKRRYIFCCTFPRVAPVGRYPTLIFCGVRTFLWNSATTQLSQR